MASWPYGDLPTFNLHEHTPRPGKRPPPFRFLDLPPEIRNLIATFVLTSDKPIRPFDRTARLREPAPCVSPVWYQSKEPDKPCTCRRQMDEHPILAFLMTCKDFHESYWLTYYQRNIFAFSGTVLPLFIANVAPRCLEQIRHVHSYLRPRPAHVWHDLGKLPRLTVLSIFLEQPRSPGGADAERREIEQGVPSCRQLERVSIERHGVGIKMWSWMNAVEVRADRRLEKRINDNLTKKLCTRQGQSAEYQEDSTIDRNPKRQRIE